MLQRRINLLPWRERLRADRQRNFWIWLSLYALGALGVVFLWHASINYYLSRQVTNNTLLMQQIAALTVKSQAAEKLQQQKQYLITQWTLWQQHYFARWWPVHFFVELTQVMPADVFLVSIKRSADQIILQGKAGSGAQIARFTQQIEQSPWLTHSILSEMKINTQGIYRHDFTLTARVKIQ